MSGTELIMGMGEVINYLKQLEEENKKLKESDKHLNKCIDSIRDQYLELKEENKKLKNDLRLCGEGLIPNDLIQRGIVETCREKVKQLEEEKDKLKNKLNVSEIKRTEAESELESFQNFTRDFDYEDNYNDWLKGNHDDYSGSWLDNWYSSEHFDKYEDGEDWEEAYGYTIKEGEYRINISGNSADWKDYVITKDGCFIRNKEGKKKVFAFVSSAEGNYIKVWDTPGMEGGLVLDEGETDLYEIIKQSFKEEIMDYVKEDHFCISTDSDEEPDSP